MRATPPLVMSHQQGDPFLLVPVEDPFDELMPEGGFVQDVLDPQHHLEPDAVIPQLVVADQGLEPGDPVGTFVQYIPGHFQGYVLHLLKVVVIGDGNGNGDGAFRQRLFVVGQVAGGNVLVGDDDHVPGGGTDGGVPPVHVHHPAGFPAGQFDVVPHPHLFGKDGGDAGKQVGQGILQGQGGSQAAGSQSGQERGNGNAVGIEDEQKTHHVHPDIHHRSQDGHGGRPFLTFGQPGFQVSRYEMGGEQGHRKDHQAVEVLVQDMPNEFGQIQDVFGQLDAQLHPQKHRQEPEGPSPGFPAAPGVFGQKVDQPSEYIMKDQDSQDIEQDKGYKMDMRAPVLEFFHQQVPGKMSRQNHPLLYNSLNK